MLIDIKRLGYSRYLFIILICLLTKGITELILNAIPLGCLMYELAKLLNQRCKRTYYRSRYFNKARHIKGRGINTVSKFINTIGSFTSARINGIKARLNGCHFCRERSKLCVKQFYLFCEFGDSIIVKALSNVAKLLHTIYHSIKTARLNI